MPYALIPDGFTLKKVTKAQEQAVNSKRRHDDVLAFIANPELMKQIVIVAAGYLALKEAQDLYDYLAEQGVNITEDVKNEYTRKRAVKGAPVGVSIEEVVENLLGRIPLL